MKKNQNWIIALILTATAGAVVLQNSASQTSDAATETARITDTLESPVIIVDESKLTSIYEGCGYMWAYHEDPEFSQKINDAVQALNPLASAKVQLFGEDCIYADGRSTFGVMETDFYIFLPVSDSTTEEYFGNWMKQVMTIIISVPKEEVQGRKGFTEFSFIKNENEYITIRVDTNVYLNDPSEISDAEFFQKFYTPLPPPTTPSPITPTATP